MGFGVDIVIALMLGALFSFSVFLKERAALAAGLVIFCLSVFLFLGSREYYVGRDTANYLEFFYWVKSGGVGSGYDYLFEAIVRAALGVYPSIYFVQGLLAILFSFFLGVSIIILLKDCDYSLRRKYAFIFSVVLLFLSPIGFEMVANATRQGLAAPFVFLFYCFLWEKKYIIALLLAVVAALLHQSSIPFCLLGLLGWLRLKYLLILAASLTLIYLGGLTSHLLAPVAGLLDASVGKRILEYGVEAGYRFGPRPDFAVFTWFAMLPILYIATKENSLQAEKMAKMAILMFIPFLIFGVASFVQRWLLYNWLFMAIANGYVLAAVSQKLRLNQAVFFLIAFVSPVFLVIYSSIKVYY